MIHHRKDLDSLPVMKPFGSNERKPAQHGRCVVGQKKKKAPKYSPSKMGG